MSSHRTRALPRGALSTNRYALTTGIDSTTRRAYRDYLKRTRGFKIPRPK